MLCLHLVARFSVQVLIMEAKMSSLVPRPALADVTNHTRKRAVEGGCGGKMSDGVEVDLQDLPVSKQICLGLENLGGQINENFSKNGLPPSLTDDEVRKKSFVSLSAAGEVEGAEAVDNLPVNAVVIKSDVVSRDSCSLVPLIHLGSDSCNADCGTGSMSQKNAVRTPNNGLPLESSLPGDCQTGDKDIDIHLDDFNFDKSESSESAKSVKPSSMQSLGLERCTSLKEDTDSNSAASAADMLKTCSCSFCLKAAYIWSDLHYQDVKGRISAAKKSKKEAVNMFQKICTVKETNLYGQGISDKTSKLESELSSQWKSLFLHMEEAFARESNQLQDNFVALKELRENCKVNLETIDAKPAEHD